jgi:7-cyano-7-deazaguanine synthase
VLCSGGLDSTTVLAIAREQGFRLYALTFDYGQRHAVELSAARRVAAAFSVERHVVVHCDLTVLGGSALTGSLKVPENRSLEEMRQEIPATYVPARNTIFLAYALAFAETEEACDIFIGANVIDYSGYPDCRPEYLKAFADMANLATKAAVQHKARYTIHAPLLYWHKAEIIRQGLSLGVDYSITHSCYNPQQELACGRCDSCYLRKKGFAEAGVADPTRYV